MEEIILENLRCFKGRHEHAVRPLTLLVGENSTGKTAFLAAVRVILDMSRVFGARTDFTEEPFDLGGYAQVASYSRPGGAPAKHFSLGFRAKTTEEMMEAFGASEFEAIATFQSFDGQHNMGHLYGDVLALFAVAVVFAFLMLQERKLSGA